MFTLLPDKKIINLGKWSIAQLDRVLIESSKIESTWQRIKRLSLLFIGLSYKKNTLIGSKDTKEVFVINLKEVDCFTFLDYIEAMRISTSYREFENNLIRVRYKGASVAFKNRKHFFTDWIEHNSDLVEDVTEAIGCKDTRKTQKFLNLKEGGKYYLQGIEPINREINYLPSTVVDAQVTSRLKTGDYVGIYSDKHGLDVSHVGIIIKDKNKIYLRHASSVKGKVVDEIFIDYIVSSPGLIILRPINH